MRFAAFTTVAASTGEANHAAGFLDNLRQQNVLAEELGFEAIWLGERHFTVARTNREGRRDCRGRHHVRLHLQRSLPRAAGVHQPG